jgi:hypothetical protein
MFFEKFLFTSRDSFGEANKTQLLIKMANHIVINLDPSTCHMEKTANDLEKLKASRTENKTVFRE